MLLTLCNEGLSYCIIKSMSTVTSPLPEDFSARMFLSTYNIVYMDPFVASKKICEERH